jgi:hypothetical protein
VTVVLSNGGYGVVDVAALVRFSESHRRRRQEQTTCECVRAQNLKDKADESCQAARLPFAKKYRRFANRRWNSIDSTFAGHLLKVDSGQRVVFECGVLHRRLCHHATGCIFQAINA